MQINKINLNNICFRQNSTNKTNSGTEKPQSTEPQKKNHWQIFPDPITDEEIEQINQTKKLPSRYKLMFVNTQLARHGNPWDPPHYEIIASSPHSKEKPATLPEGYQIQKNKHGKLEVVKINKS